MRVNGSLVRQGLVKAYRAAVYAFVGSAGVANVPQVKSLADAKIAAGAWVLAMFIAASAGVVAFLVTTAEGLAERPLVGPRDGPVTLPSPSSAPPVE